MGLWSELLPKKYFGTSLALPIKYIKKLQFLHLSLMSDVDLFITLLNEREYISVHLFLKADYAINLAVQRLKVLCIMRKGSLEK